MFLLPTVRLERQVRLEDLRNLVLYIVADAEIQGREASESIGRVVVWTVPALEKTMFTQERSSDVEMSSTATGIAIGLSTLGLSGTGTSHSGGFTRQWINRLSEYPAIMGIEVRLQQRDGCQVATVQLIMASPSST